VEKREEELADIVYTSDTSSTNLFGLHWQIIVSDSYQNGFDLPVSTSCDDVSHVTDGQNKPLSIVFIPCKVLMETTLTINIPAPSARARGAGVGGGGAGGDKQEKIKVCFKLLCFILHNFTSLGLPPQ
jgi:hypothetical protein